ncbi:hypothetical protein K7X08_019639 [Anisodus acutangulus]|uniref:Uncharacterized protein n=1 Tax=Anisodus acutangulus TaxID=402998 RepID=A0A9Q1MSS1_9SOLA|nr:hypothetical protein K7X08_019639 [Anisodus acutangulus]
MTSSFSCSRLQISCKSFWTTPPSGSACIKFIKARRQVVNARFERHNRGGSKIVDENMIILRMRIKEMKLLEAGKSRPPSNWMGWEKKYFAYYNEDVCEVIETKSTLSDSFGGKFNDSSVAIKSVSISDTVGQGQTRSTPSGNF